MAVLDRPPPEPNRPIPPDILKRIGWLAEIKHDPASANSLAEEWGFKYQPNKHP